MKKSLVLSVDVFLILLAIGSSFLALIVFQQNIQVVRVVSNSMSPSIHRGDALIFKSVPTANISEGNILLLPLADDSGASYVHRVVKKEINKDLSVRVTTKGDANPVEDNWKLTITSARTPLYVATIPAKDIPILDVNRWLIFGILVFLLPLLIRIIFPRQKTKVQNRNV